MLSMVLRTMPTVIKSCTAVFIGSPGASTQLPSFVELKLSRQEFHRCLHFPHKDLVWSNLVVHSVGDDQRMDMSPPLSFIVPLPVFATPDCQSDTDGITVGRGI